MSRRDQTETQMTLAQLARKMATPPRTIRYYIARGLMDGPAKAGRAASYGPDHFRRIQEIQKLQEQGRTLAEIEWQLRGGQAKRTALRPETVWSYALAPDVTIQVAAGAAPWRQRQIQQVIEEVAARLRQPEKQQ
jgi:DNA-binding transcriptional MerR regulator